MAEYRRYAFISYNHKDVVVAKWLHRRLERYRLPSSVHNDYEASRYLRPVFRDQEDLSGGVLRDELREELLTSRYLIVICSPYSAESEWVSREVQTFIDAGRDADIIPVVVSGDAQKDLPRALREYIEKHPERELLAISLSEVGKEKAFIRVVSRMLQVGFDSLWQRQLRRKRLITALIAIATIVLAGLFYWLAVPVRLTVSTEEQTLNLPGWNEAAIEVAGGEYEVDNTNCTIAGYRRGQKVNIRFHADRNYRDIDTLVTIGWGVRQTVLLTLERNEAYAVYAGRVYRADDDYEDYPIEGAEVTIGSQSALTDADGAYRIVFRPDEQTEFKRLRITCPGYKPLEREEEPPATRAVFLLKR